MLQLVKGRAGQIWVCRMVAHFVTSLVEVLSINQRGEGESQSLKHYFSFDFPQSNACTILFKEVLMMLWFDNQGCDFVHYTLFYINVSKMYIIYIIFDFCTLYIIFVKHVHYFINYTLFFKFLCKTRCAGSQERPIRRL